LASGQTPTMTPAPESRPSARAGWPGRRPGPSGLAPDSAASRSAALPPTSSNRTELRPPELADLGRSAIREPLHDPLRIGARTRRAAHRPHTE
jgi:hypothetical protein